MDFQIIVFVIATFFISAFLKGITGLGFSTICLPILTFMIDLKSSIPLVILPSISSNILVMLNAGNFSVAAKRFWKMYLSAIPGLILGLWVLNSVNSSSARAFLGVVLLIYTIWALSRSEFVLSARTASCLTIPVGTLTGFVNGVTGSQMIPILPYLLSLKLEKNLFVQSINISFTLSSLVMLIGLGGLGLLDQQTLFLAGGGIIPVAIGIKLGGKIRKHITDEIFRKLVLIFLILVAFSLIARI
ncbi:MAG: sulfite exporter TauE/SafE family protein [SAR324 cluster bacterium]|nr:sulfite exporter TauE/SafE family protein [SAR324 cluster bacterium]